jgi:hypothetical protein
VIHGETFALLLLQWTVPAADATTLLPGPQLLAFFAYQRAESPATIYVAVHGTPTMCESEKDVAQVNDSLLEIKYLVEVSCAVDGGDASSHSPSASIPCDAKFIGGTRFATLLVPATDSRRPVDAVAVEQPTAGLLPSSWSFFPQL